jgi:hypothetical protein
LGAKDMRNFKLSSIEDNAFFKDHFSICYFTNQSIRGLTKKTENEISILRISKIVADLFAFVRLWKFRDRGISFLIRAESFFSFPWEQSLFRDAEHNGSSKQKIKVTVFVRLFSLPIFFWLLRRIFGLCSLIEKRRNSDFLTNFKLVVIPYEGRLDGAFDLTVEICKLNGIKTFAIQSNWDNLSSKNFIFSSPDYFGVWGKQSESHLKTIQRKPSIPTVLLGNPRRLFPVEVSHTIKPNKIEVKGNTNDSLIIFAGHGVGDSDNFILQAIVDARDELALPFHIIYRPHPFARSKMGVEGLSWLKSQSIDVVEEVTPEDNEHFIDKLRSSSLLISQMSTLCIEALEFGVPVCIPTFSNIISNFGFEQAVNSLTHYAGVLLIPGVKVAYTRSGLAAQIKHSLLENSLIGGVDWICSQVNFTDELIAKLTEILLDVSNPS